MKVEIWSDVICPWCYIGKRRFEMALAEFETRESVSLSPALSRERERGTRSRDASPTINVIWRSFELDLKSPAQYPETLEQMLARKYKVSPQEAAAMNARVTSVAKEVGLEYHLANARPGNTFDAHRLLHFAAARQLGDRATERIMHAYFSESLAVGERAALARLAPEFGIGESDALALLESEEYSDAVRADEARAAKFGISGVPYFLFNENSYVSGAQPVAMFAQALQEAWDGA